MSALTHVWLYGGTTCEDVYAELDDPRASINLEMMASPQCAFVATDYSEHLVNDLARDMWEYIFEGYEDPDEPDLFGSAFEHLHKVVSSKVCERPEGFEGVLPVTEVTEINYYAETDMEQSDPLMLIVVQKRPIWQRVDPAEFFRRDDTDRAE